MVVPFVRADESTNPTPNPTEKEEYRQQLRSAKLTQRADPNSPIATQLTQAAQQKTQAQLQNQGTKEQFSPQVAGVISQNIDKALEHQALLQEKIRNNPGLSEEAKTRVLSKINNHIRQLQQIKSQSSTAESSEDVASVRIQAREQWEKYQGNHFQYNGLHIAGQFQSFLDRLQRVADRFQARLEQNETLQSQDLSAIYLSLESFDAYIADAQQLINQATALFNTIDENAVKEDARTTFQSGMQHLRDAKNDLREANQHLRRAMMQTYRLLGTTSEESTE